MVLADNVEYDMVKVAGYSICYAMVTASLAIGFMEQMLYNILYGHEVLVNFTNMFGTIAVEAAHISAT